MENTTNLEEVKNNIECGEPIFLSENFVDTSRSIVNVILKSLMDGGSKNGVIYTPENLGNFLLLADLILDEASSNDNHKGLFLFGNELVETVTRIEETKKSGITKNNEKIRYSENFLEITIQSIVENNKIEMFMQFPQLDDKTIHLYQYSDLSEEWIDEIIKAPVFKTKITEQEWY